jgi:rare lipoprotein A
VTNLENGRSVVVRLNDRGPFAKDRIIDLSRAAAEQLDMIRKGTARVEVRSLAAGGAAAAAPATPAPAAGPAYSAHAGAFASRANADALAARLTQAGIAGVSVSESTVDGRSIWRVRAGPAASFAEYDALAERLRLAGADSVRLAL